MTDQSNSPIFINSVLEPGNTGSILVAQTVDVGAQRQIRHHKKSRQGCVGCKLRKVKCDERQPCSSCLKRGTPCISPRNRRITSRQTKHTIDLGPGINAQMSLLQLELFHHWEKYTRSTLVYPEIWPVVMQHAFQENFVMASILCTSAMHLSTLHSQSRKYSDLASWLMPRSMSLFRQSLSMSTTKNNAEAIVGTAMLINYISWFDLSFLHGVANTIDPLIWDPLLLVSSGITHVWFQSIPILIEENSVFLKVMTRHPRLIIEQALSLSDSTGLVVQSLMDIWDDPRYQISGSMTPNTAVYEPANHRAWRLLQGLEIELLPPDFGQRPTPKSCGDFDKLQRYKEGVAKITRRSVSIDSRLQSLETKSLTQARTSFAYIVRRISPLMHCETLSSTLNPDIWSKLATIQDDIEQLIYGFPILCCGPFADLVQKRDTRALVLLLHFYRSARTLLDIDRCWWARARTAKMEQLIANELRLRGLGTYLDSLNHKTVDHRQFTNVEEG